MLIIFSDWIHKKVINLCRRIWVGSRRKEMSFFSSMPPFFTVSFHLFCFVFSMSICYFGLKNKINLLSWMNQIWIIHTRVTQSTGVWQVQVLISECKSTHCFSSKIVSLKINNVSRTEQYAQWCSQFTFQGKLLILHWLATKSSCVVFNHTLNNTNVYFDMILGEILTSPKHICMS